MPGTRIARIATISNTCMHTLSRWSKLYSFLNVSSLLLLEANDTCEREVACAVVDMGGSISSLSQPAERAIVML